MHTEAAGPDADGHVQPAARHEIHGQPRGRHRLDPVCDDCPASDAVEECWVKCGVGRGNVGNDDHIMQRLQEIGVDTADVGSTGGCRPGFQRIRGASILTTPASAGDTESLRALLVSDREERGRRRDLLRECANGIDADWDRADGEEIKLGSAVEVGDRDRSCHDRGGAGTDATRRRVIDQAVDKGAAVAADHRDVVGATVEVEGGAKDVAACGLRHRDRRRPEQRGGAGGEVGLRDDVASVDGLSGAVPELDSADGGAEAAQIFSLRGTWWRSSELSTQAVEILILIACPAQTGSRRSRSPPSAFGL